MTDNSAPPESHVARVRRRRWRRRTVLALGLLVLILCWLGSSLTVAVLLTRRARPRQQEPVPQLSWGMVSELRLKTSDGEELGGWFIDGRSDRPIVLLLHGNGASRSRSLPEAEFVAELGSAVMLISHRAHGDSSGEYNDIGYSARKDVLAAVDWLREHKPGRPIVVWGRSLGSAAALFAAPELRETVVGFILECPYADLRQAVRNRTEFFLPLGLEQIAYAGLLTVSPLVLPHLNDISPRQAAA